MAKKNEGSYLSCVANGEFYCNCEFLNKVYKGKLFG